MDTIRRDERIAITYAGKKISYRELNENILTLSKELEIEKGDIIGIYMENRPEWVYSLFAIWHRGGIAVPIDFESPKKQIEDIISDTNMKQIVTSDRGSERLAEKHNIDVEKIAVEDLASFSGQLEELNIPQGEEDALILFTSGTSGRSKGVVLAGRSLFCNVKDYAELGMVDKDDVISSFLPLHHAFPLNATCLTPLYIGATMAMSRGVTSEDLKEVFATNKLTMLVAVPRVFIALHNGIMKGINKKAILRTLFKLAEKIDNYKFRRILFAALHKKFGGCIRVCISGGAKLDPQLWSDFETLAFPMVEGYGLSETSPALTGNSIDKRRVGTVGKALGHVQLKTVDGELWAKGDVVMKGYYNNIKETQKVLDKDGWFKTGDLASIDKDGYVTIKGRKNSLIVLSNGKNINPEPLEKKLLAMSEYIEEAVVVGHKDLLKVVVDLKVEARVLKDIDRRIQSELDKLNKEVKSYEQIRDFAICQEEFPKTPIGKIKRYLVKFPEKISEVTRKEVEEPKDKVYNIIKGFVSELKGREVVGIDRFERDLAMDSLDFLELKAMIEGSFDIELDEDFFIEKDNILKVYEAIGDRYTGNRKLKKKSYALDLTKKDGRWHTRVSKALKPIINFYCGSLKELELEGDASIIIANHQSFVDSLLINQVLPKKLREDSFYIAKDKHFESRIMKEIEKRGNIILLDYNNIEELIEGAKNILAKGKSLIIFPEGTRSLDGSLGEFKRSFLHIAKEAGVEIKLLGVKGAYDVWPRDKKLPKRGRVEVDYLGSLNPDKVEGVEEVEKIYEEWLSK